MKVACKLAEVPHFCKSWGIHQKTPMEKQSKIKFRIRTNHLKRLEKLTSTKLQLSSHSWLGWHKVTMMYRKRISWAINKRNPLSANGQGPMSLSTPSVLCQCQAPADWAMPSKRHVLF